VLHFF